MEFKRIVEERYATKQFNGKKIPEEKINELKEIIRHSASSFGIQPWKIKVVADQKTKDELQAASWNQLQIGSCSHLLVFCADTNTEALIKRLGEELSKTDMPSEALESYMKMMTDFASGLHGDKRLSWSQRQVYIALGNAINGAKALGFDSCPMEGFDPASYSRILGLPKNLVPSVLCPIGYAADKPRKKARFSSGEVFF